MLLETRPAYGFSSLRAQILQTLKDYDCRNTLLLPPRAPGEKLPPEVLEYYQDQKRLQDEQTKSKTGEPAGQDNGEGLALAVLSVYTAGSPARMPRALRGKPRLLAATHSPAGWRNSSVKVCGL